MAVVRKNRRIGRMRADDIITFDTKIFKWRLSAKNGAGHHWAWGSGVLTRNKEGNVNILHTTFLCQSISLLFVAPTVDGVRCSWRDLTDRRGLVSEEGVQKKNGVNGVRVHSSRGHSISPTRSIL